MKTNIHRSPFASERSREPKTPQTYQIFLEGQPSEVITARSEEQARHKARLHHPGKVTEVVRVW